MDLADKDKRYVWHPFTQMASWVDEKPLVIERADGNYLIDTDGNRYLDGVSSLWVTVHGHNHPVINAAIREQLDRVSHTTLLGLANVPSIELAEQLIAIAPTGLSKVFYSDNGSTAVEVAAKMAFQYWALRGRPQKRRFVALANAYHGDTLGAVSVGGIDLFHRIFSTLLFDVLRTPTPYVYRHVAKNAGACRDDCLAKLAVIFKNSAHEIAALVIEPLVQGAAGIITHPSGFLRGVADLCKRFDVLLICDEVATGFGRTGTMFACEQERVIPDLLCIAKGMTGGYLPLAATLVRDNLYDAFLGSQAEQKTFFHGHTYTGNPLACAAALANLHLFKQNQVLTHVQRISVMLAAELSAHVKPLPHVGEVRQRGLMVGIEVVKDKASKELHQGDPPMGARICQRARELGVILRALGPVIVLMPPLSTTTNEISHLVDTARRCIVAETQGQPL